MSTKQYESSEVWAERIRKQQSSGMTQREWCRSENVSVNTFQGWISRLEMQLRNGSENADKHGAFIKVVPKKTDPQTNDGTPVATGGIDLTVVRLRLPVGYSQSSLSDLLGEFTKQ